MKTDCLYQLPDDRYQRVVDYLKRTGGDTSCACTTCKEQRNRVQMKESQEYHDMLVRQPSHHTHLFPSLMSPCVICGERIGGI